jgi:hypothetical protein
MRSRIAAERDETMFIVAAILLVMLATGMLTLF